jgi:hypothetical protein
VAGCGENDGQLGMVGAELDGVGPKRVVQADERQRVKVGCECGDVPFFMSNKIWTGQKGRLTKFKSKTKLPGRLVNQSPTLQPVGSETPSTPSSASCMRADPTFAIRSSAKIMNLSVYVIVR